MTISRHNPTCRETLSFLDALVDGELAAEDRAAVERHVSACAACRSELEELTSVDRRLRAALHSNHQSKADELARQFEGSETGAVETARAPVRWSRRDTLSWLACAAAAVVVILMARPLTPPAPKALVDATPVAGQLVAATGEIQYQPSEGAWQSLAANNPMALAEGGRLRTQAASCEIQLPQNAKLRLQRDSEVVLHRSDRVQLLQGHLWARGPDGGGNLVVEVPTVGAEVSQEIMMNCPSNSEMQWAVHPSHTSVSASTKVEMRSGNFACDVMPGQTVTVDRDLKSPAVFTSADAEHEKSWQIPLLHMQGDAAKEELDRLLESVLSRIGFTKASFFHEAQIRALGPPGAPPLLAYARTPKSREKQDIRRRAAQLGAELADASMIASLRTLSLDDDPQVREPIQKAMERLEATSAK